MRSISCPLWIPLMEVLGVIVLGHIAAGPVISLLRVGSLGPTLEGALKAPAPNFYGLSSLLLQILAVQYGCLFAVAFSIMWLRRRLSGDASPYPGRQWGFTFGGQSFRSHVKLAVAAFAVFSLPVQVLQVVHHHVVPLGTGPVWWQLMDKPWTVSFWVFFAAGSFVVIPFAEEIFYRGYCQSRLQQAAADMGPALIVALLFTFIHAQYQEATVLGIGMIVCLFPIALGLGYLFWRTRSLIAPILFHAAINVPTKGIFRVLVLLATLLVLFILRRQVWEILVDLWRNLTGIPRKAVVLLASVLGVIVAVGFQRWPWPFLIASATGLLIALVLGYCERKRALVSLT